MIFKVFVVYDDKAKAYCLPFFLPEVGQAVRAFADSVNDLSHPIGQHPEDYYLFQAGTFDNASGKLLSDDTLLYVAHGIELRKRVEDVVLGPGYAKPGSVNANGQGLQE